MFSVAIVNDVALHTHTHTHTHTHNHFNFHLFVAKTSFFFFYFPGRFYRASLVAQMVKNLPAMQETGVCSLGWEDPLEKAMAMHSSILAWRIRWTEKVL